MADPAAHTPDVDTLVKKLTIALTWVPWDRRREADAALSDLAAIAREWLTPFDGSGIGWHESLPSPYTYQASDLSKLVAAVHEYECRAIDAEADRDRLQRLADDRLALMKSEEAGWQAECDGLARRVAELEAAQRTLRAAVRECCEALTSAENDTQRLREGLSEVRLRHMYSEPKAGEALAVWVLNGWSVAVFAPKEEPYASSEARYQERIRIRDTARALAGDGGGA